MRFATWNVLALLLPVCAALAGEPNQATAPAADWAQTVQDLAEALGSGASAEQVTGIVGSARLRGLAPGEQMSVPQILTVAASSMVVGHHAYPAEPTALAADIAADFERLDDLSDEQRQAMIPQTPQEMQRANDIASEWVRATLGGGASGPVGVIVLWSPQPEGQGIGVCHIMLLAGQRASGRTVLVDLAFGNPVAP